MTAMHKRLLKLERLRKPRNTFDDVLIYVMPTRRDANDLIGFDGVPLTREPLETCDAFRERVEAFMLSTRPKGTGPLITFARFADDDND